MIVFVVMPRLAGYTITFGAETAPETAGVAFDVGAFDGLMAVEGAQLHDSGVRVTLRRRPELAAVDPRVERIASGVRWSAYDGAGAHVAEGTLDLGALRAKDSVTVDVPAPTVGLERVTLTQ